MSSNWKLVRLGEVSTIRRGSSPRPILDYMAPEGMPWVKISDATESKSRYIDKTNEFIKHEGVSRSVIVNKGDLILSNSGTAGLPKFMAITACIHDGWQVFTDLVGIDKEFLYYTLLNIRSKLLHNAYDSTMKNLTLDMVRDAQIRLPSIDEQKKITRILSSIDEKIENNQHINQTLEQMAQAIFKSWYVDFEPVKAKIAALEAGGSAEDALLAAMQAISGKNEAQLTLLQTEQPEQYAELRATAELFPSAMQGSELGEIPEGWEVLSLSEMVELIGGGTPKKSELSFWNGSICWFSVKDTPNEGNVFVVDTEEKITEEGLKHSSTKLLPLGTTIITARGTVGKLALTGVATAMNQSCYGVIGCDGTGPYLNYLRLKNAVDTLKQNTHGAVFDTITRSTFETVIQPRSCLALRQRFEKFAQPLFEEIRNNLLQSNALSETRDLLLPKLLSGELRLPEVEGQIQEAADAV